MWHRRKPAGNTCGSTTLPGDVVIRQSRSIAKKMQIEKKRSGAGIFGLYSLFADNVARIPNLLSIFVNAAHVEARTLAVRPTHSIRRFLWSPRGVGRC